MSKCGKGFLPECEYFSTGGCTTPFNCVYKVEECGQSTVFTSGDANNLSGIEKFFIALSKGGVLPQEPMNYDGAAMKAYISYLEFENLRLQEKLAQSIELPCVQCVKTRTWINMTEFGDIIYEWAVVYRNNLGEFVVETCRSKEEAERRLKEVSSPISLL